MSLLAIEPIQVIATALAADTGATRLEAFKTARVVQLALAKAGFVIVRRKYVRP